MGNEAVFAMKFAKVFPLLIAKAERKGHTKAEVYEVRFRHQTFLCSSRHITPKWFFIRIRRKSSH